MTEPTLPEPGLEPSRLTHDEFVTFTPEHFELIQGHLFDQPRTMEWRRKLLALLLKDVGLVEAVRLAPEERWREALGRAYP